MKTSCCESHHGKEPIVEPSFVRLAHTERTMSNFIGSARRGARDMGP